MEEEKEVHGRSPCVTLGRHGLPWKSPLSGTGGGWGWLMQRNRPALCLATSCQLAGAGLHESAANQPRYSRESALLLAILLSPGKQGQTGLLEDERPCKALLNGPSRGHPKPAELNMWETPSRAANWIHRGTQTWGWSSRQTYVHRLIYTDTWAHRLAGSQPCDNSKCHLFEDTMLSGGLLLSNS